MAKNSYNIITFLTIIFILLVTIDNTPNAASLSKQNKFPGLYALDDNIELLTDENFDKKLYGKRNAWLIEFYSNWCGHCQQFAPHWISFAKDVLPWTNHVKIGAIDCAHPNNTPVCRQFEIMGYPTVRYFHEYFEAGPSNIGQAMKTSGDVDFLRRNLVEILKFEQSKGNAQHIPSLWPTVSVDVTELRMNVGKNPFVFVIVESENSTLCAEVILDYAYTNDVIVKCVKTTQSALVSQLKVMQVPTLLVILKDFGIIPITPRHKNRTNFKDAIQVFLKSKGVEVPQPEPYVFNKDLSESVINIEDLKDILEKLGDVTFQVDLENTIHYSLKHEISAMKIIDGSRFKALLDFFDVLIKYFPFGENGINFLKELRFRAEQSGDSISGEAISSHIHELEKQYDIYSLPLQWIACRGSEATRRGYPCGLWKLFHFLTVRYYELDPYSQTNEVLSAMHGYIKNFFGCIHCSQHFQNMAKERRIFDVRTPRESILWLWASHNVVNQRLSGDQTEDPSFPKVVFPTAGRCPTCRFNDGTWNEEEVLNYMNRVYSAENLLIHLPEKSNNYVKPASRASRISSFDVSLYLLLYICSAGMLVLIIRLFLRKGYRKKAYVHDLLGKV